MKTQKGIIHVGLIIVLLVLGIGALGYVMYKTNSLPQVTTTSSPTPSYISDDTEEWLPYVNEKLGFAFRYPKYWPEVQYPGETEVNESEDRVSISFLESGMSFSVVANKTAKQWFSEKISDSSSYNRYDLLEETELNGYSAFKTTFYGDRFDEFYYLIQRNKNLIVISTNLDEYTRNQILLNFEFIDDNNLSSRKLFASDEKLIGDRPLPNELLNLRDSELIDMSCSKYYQNDYNGKYFSYIGSQPIELTDPTLLSITKKDDSIWGISKCDISDGRILINYLIAAGGGGMGNVAHFAFLNQKNELDEKVTIPNDGAPYFNCFKAYALTNNDTLYYRCGGGDGGFGQVSIYKIDLKSLQTTRVIKCTSWGSEIECK